LGNALVMSGVVIVVNVLLHDAIGIPFTQDDEVIQAFTPKTAQEAWTFSKRCCLAQLLSQPYISGMACNSEVHDAALLQFNDDKNEDGAEE